MGTALEELRVLQDAEIIADGIWHNVVTWQPLAKDVVGLQLARAVDSIGANIAEAYGRYHYGEKIRFLYYARGSLFETKFWLNRVLKRQLMGKNEVEQYIAQLNNLSRQLNAFINSIKLQQQHNRTLREPAAEYITTEKTDWPLIAEDNIE